MKKIVLVYYCDSTRRREIVDYSTKEQIEEALNNEKEAVKLTDINGNFNGKYAFTDRIHWIENFN